MNFTLTSHSQELSFQAAKKWLYLITIQFNKTPAEYPHILEQKREMQLDLQFSIHSGHNAAETWAATSLTSAHKMVL